MSHLTNLIRGKCQLGGIGRGVLLANRSGSVVDDIGLRNYNVPFSGVQLG